MDDLPRLLQDAVSHVEPTDRLAEIRERTARRPPRVGWYAAGAATLATAAAVTAVAVVTSRTTPEADNRDPVGPPSASTTPPDSRLATAVYYLGPGPDGPRGDDFSLYRELENDVSAADALTSVPRDPDYRTLWPEGSIEGIGDPEAGESVVTLGRSFPADLPEGVTTQEAELALQQVVYTVRAAYQEDISIRLLDGAGPVERVFGVATPGGVVTAAPELDVLSHMNISDPPEGLVVRGSFTARGGANGFEGTVGCRLTSDGGEVAWEGATIAGWQEEKLFPWRLSVDLDGVAPGTYTLWCSTDDPTAGTEGRGADVDTRTVVVE